MTPSEAAGIANIQKTLMQRLNQQGQPQTGEAGIVNIQNLLQDLFAAPPPPAQVQQVRYAPGASVTSATFTSIGTGASYTPTRSNGVLLTWNLNFGAATSGSLNLYRTTGSVPPLGTAVTAGDTRIQAVTIGLTTNTPYYPGATYDIGPSPNGLVIGQTYNYYFATAGTFNFVSSVAYGMWITEI